jgi:CheY-like chemotaxis protein
MNDPCEALSINPAPVLHRYRIAVIDARSDSAFVLRRLLEFDGHEVQCATDGRSGVELVGSMEPDIVLSSISLLDLDGFEVASEIRRRLGKKPLVIAVTSYGKSAIGARLKEAGFDLLLPKPFSREMLTEAIAVLDGVPASPNLQL